MSSKSSGQALHVKIPPLYLVREFLATRGVVSPDDGGHLHTGEEVNDLPWPDWKSRDALFSQLGLVDFMVLETDGVGNQTKVLIEGLLCK